MLSTELELISISVISRACSPVSGWLTSRLLTSMPNLFAQVVSRACSASMNAATPPARWALAMTWSARVVLPDDSGPNSSVTLPRGMPLPPSAMSSDNEPVPMPSILAYLCSSICIIAPWPYCFSICAITRCSASSLLVALAVGSAFFIFAIFASLQTLELRT